MIHNVVDNWRFSINTFDSISEKEDCQSVIKKLLLILLQKWRFKGGKHFERQAQLGAPTKEVPPP